MDDLVSVVIPTRNRPDYVCRAVRSALLQTHTRLEVIVVVDGPDPATVHALSQIKDQRLRVMALESNVGGSEARNTGIRVAAGTWIAMLDDDDEWLPDKLMKQLAAVTTPAAKFSLVTCRRIERRDGHADVLAPRRSPYPGEDSSEYMFVSDDGQKHICGPQTSSFFGTKALFTQVPFTKGLKCHQDWDWYLRAMHQEGIVATMLNDPLYVMDVEPVRPRLTQVAQWQLSSSWLESNRHLFTPSAFSSFIIHECMFRCDQVEGRVGIFRKLLAIRRRSSRLSLKDVFSIIKWYLFRPTVRIALVRKWHLFSERKFQIADSGVHSASGGKY